MEGRVHRCWLAWQRNRRAERRTDRIGGVEVEIVLLIEAIRGRGLVFPAHTQIQRQLTGGLPVVLEVDSVVMLRDELQRGNAGRAERRTDRIGGVEVEIVLLIEAIRSVRR